MRWLRRRSSDAAPRRPQTREATEPTETTAAEDEAITGWLACATCGQPLAFDPEDEPEGDVGLPICGECNRSRNFDVMLEGELNRD